MNNYYIEYTADREDKVYSMLMRGYETEDDARKAFEDNEFYDEILSVEIVYKTIYP